MKTFIVLLCLLSLSQALGANLVSNVTLGNIDEFKFRSTTMASLSVLVYNGAMLTSLGVGAEIGEVGLDVVLASLVTATTIPPSTYVSYFNAGVKKNGLDPLDGIEFKLSKAIIANTYIKIEEVTDSGKVVKTRLLGGLDRVYSVSESRMQNGGVGYITMQTKELLKSIPIVGGILGSDTFIFSVTGIFSDVVGVLDVVGNPLVTPKSLETIVKISGWDYSSDANRLVLSIGIASLSGSVESNSQVTYSGGRDSDGVFMILNKKARVDGNDVDIEVSSLKDSNALEFGNLKLSTQVTLKYPVDATFKMVKVKFPKAARDIEYDPTIGAGANPPKPAPSSGTTTNASSILCLSLLSIIALLF